MNRNEIKLEALKNIDTVFDKLETLESKKENLSHELKQKYDMQKQALIENKNKLVKSYEALQNAKDDNLKELEQTYSKALNHFKEGYGEIEKIFKK